MCATAAHAQPCMHTCMRTRMRRLRDLDTDDLDGAAEALQSLVEVRTRVRTAYSHFRKARL